MSQDEYNSPAIDQTAPSGVEPHITVSQQEDITDHPARSKTWHTTDTSKERTESLQAP